MAYIHGIGVTTSWSGWSATGTGALTTSNLWTIEGVAVSHIVLAGLLWAASLWHWALEASIAEAVRNTSNVTFATHSDLRVPWYGGGLRSGTEVIAIS